jgi:anionic cell wall polymer biosynthesis LytR-Cps2A-Psr (LCP) family protein
VDDKASKLTLPAGKSLLNGEKALGYVRLRHYGDGSDIQRIKRQQTLLLTMLKKARTLIGDPDKLKDFLAATRKSVKTDLSVEFMYELATGMSKTRVTFLTVPWTPDREDRNRIAWKQPEADKLFKSLR